MTEPIREYVPSQPPVNKTPATPTYELKSTVAGKIHPPTFIGLGELKAQVPYPPKSNCKKCMGKGHLGLDIKNKKIFLCHKYRWMRN